MTRKEQFLMFVYLGALSQDLRDDTMNAQQIARLASNVPEENIPNCPMNAAKVFVAHCSGLTTRPFRWMA